MSTQYRLEQWGKTASGGCSAGQGSSEPVAPRIYLLFITTSMLLLCDHSVYLTRALHISCLLDAPRNFSNDFTQVHTVYYTIVSFYPSLIMFYFH
jgi:hypothetical protein